ncbi:MAG: HAMP domain-containing sensor histidine kinase [Alphaproteobacteria bacterium]
MSDNVSKPSDIMGNPGLATGNRPVSPKTTKDAIFHALGDFAHELRNPLNAVYGYSQLLSDLDASEIPPEKLRDYAETINKGVRQALQVCERVLANAVEETPEVQLTQVEVGSLINDVIDILGKIAEQKKINLRSSIQDNFPNVRTDPLLMRQYLLNVVGNAVKCTPSGGAVEIRATMSARGDAMIIVVQDTGPGIPSAILSQLQMGREIIRSVPDQGGFGRGLRISQDIAQKLGAALELYNDPAGGAVCVLRQPIAKVVPKKA